MTTEMSAKSYQAVRCYYCSEPIPLSVRLLELCGTTTEPQCQSYVFILRCEACSKESRYLKSEIEIFESESSQNANLNRFGPRRSLSPYRNAAGF